MIDLDLVADRFAEHFHGEQVRSLDGVKADVVGMSVSVLGVRHEEDLPHVVDPSANWLKGNLGELGLRLDGPWRLIWRGLPGDVLFELATRPAGEGAAV